VPDSSFDFERVKRFKNFSNLDLRSNESSVNYNSHSKLPPRNPENLNHFGSEISLTVKRKIEGSAADLLNVSLQPNE
jgi:hypothetical protein